ncbi:helix-turn-helix domain-containing protein [Kocuria rhizosphaericola]
MRLVRSRTLSGGLAQQARIVLLAADGTSNTEIAQEVGTPRNTVMT